MSNCIVGICLHVFLYHLTSLLIGHHTLLVSVFLAVGTVPRAGLGGRSRPPRGEIVSLAVAQDIRGPFAYKRGPLDTPEWWEWSICMER